MQPLHTYLAGTLLENEIGNLIQKSVSQDERLYKDYFLSYHESFYEKEFLIDYFLPDGCSALNFPDKTAIEIKINLTVNTLKTLYQLYKPVFDNKQINKLVIVTAVSNDYLQNFVDGFHEKKILVLDKTKLIEFVAKNTKQDIKQLTNDIQIKPNENIEKVGPSIIERAKKAYCRDKYSLFLGAGVSMDAHLPSWTSLLENLLREKREIPFKYINEENTSAIEEVLGHSTIVTARYIFDGYQRSLYNGSDSISFGLNERARNEILSRLRETLYGDRIYRSKLINSITNAIKRRNPEQVISYNYDDLLENKLNDKRKYKSIIDANYDRSKKIVPIYHVHGLINRDENCPSMPVLSETEYHRLYSSMYNWANVVQLHALNTTTCFFIGFSMTDPNQRRLLEISRYESLNSSAQDGQLPHFVFLKKQKLKGEAVAEVNQEHLEEMEYMMSCFGLNVVWFNDFKDLPLIIDYIIGKRKDCPI